MEKTCIVCNKEFQRPKRRGFAQWAKQTCCSYECYHKRPFSQETKEKMSETHKNKPNSGQFQKGQIFTAEMKEKLSRAGLGRKKTREHIRKILRRRPMSSLELKFQSYIDKYNLPYKFVGNGKFFIENINPDFININGEKKAVEVYYKKHKELFRSKTVEEWKQERINIYSKYGWNILFIEACESSEQSVLEILNAKS